MSTPQSLHSICRWTFNAGKGGFVPAGVRPAWAADRLDTAGMVRLVKERIAPRLPAHVALGLEVHYDAEINERNAAAVTDALAAANMHLALISFNAHAYCAYGGVASLDPDERARAADLAQRTVELAYGPLRSTWHPDPKLAPSFVIWNGSLGYDLATIGIRRMYRNLKESVARLCDYEKKKGGMLYFAIEPKPNEGHPAMLLPTVASAILFWKRLREEFGTDISRMGVNKEFGHSEMIGLDHVYDTVEEIDSGMLIHMHLNSQGYNDGIVLGGPGKYDIDHGTRINGMNIAIAGLIADAGFSRWKGHDMQVRAYDDEEQGIDRVVRSILSWEACAEAARNLDVAALLKFLQERRTAQADLMRAAVVDAQRSFDRMYRG